MQQPCCKVHDRGLVKHDKMYVTDIAKHNDLHQVSNTYNKQQYRIICIFFITNSTIIVWPPEGWTSVAWLVNNTTASLKRAVNQVIKWNLYTETSQYVITGPRRQFLNDLSSTREWLYLHWETTCFDSLLWWYLEWSIWPMKHTDYTTTCMP